MAKARSPQYPIIGLKDAIERVELAYRKDYQNQVPRAVIAQHMGYQTLNGKSLGVLAALGKYGLLEGRGDNTRVTDLAVRIIAHMPGDPERVKALAEAATTPELFRELDGRFGHGKASDQALRSFLLTQKFIPSAADSAIRAYRETKGLVETEGGVYDSPPTESESPMTALALPSPSPARAVYMTASAAQHAHQPPAVPVEDDEPYKVSVSRKGMRVVANLADEDAVDELIATLEANKALMRRMAKIASTSAKETGAPAAPASGEGED